MPAAQQLQRAPLLGMFARSDIGKPDLLALVVLNAAPSVRSLTATLTLCHAAQAA